MRTDPSARRIVIDTNVWISAALSPHAPPSQLVRVALSRGVPVFSEATFAEIETRLWRPKFDRYLTIEQRNRILHDLNAAAFWVDVPADLATKSYCRDANDDKFVHAALAADARWLITGDKDLLELNRIDNVNIVTPSQALAEPTFLN